MISTLAESITELVHDARDGDQAAWRTLEHHLGPRLRATARRSGARSDDVEDAVQLTWLKCLEHLDQLQNAENLPAWLSTICRNEALRIARSRAREVVTDDPEAATARPDRLPRCRDGEQDPVLMVLAQDQRHRLQAAVAALPPHQRRVVVALLDGEGDSYADLSRRLGVTQGYLGPTRKRAIERLRGDPQLRDVA
jgi:RNA polymerase sigma factor (sigma-70 family)